jgi:hypothetical protein
MGDGIEKELEGIDLGDLRLNRRSQEILKSLAVNPQASVNAASQKWSDTMAAYRFLTILQLSLNKSYCLICRQQNVV